MRYLSTVYVRNHRARIRSRKGALLISSPEGKQRIPLEAVDSLILMGGAQVTTQALDACIRRGVRISSLRLGGSVRFIVSGATGGNVHLRLAQYRAVTDESHSLEIARVIVAAKLRNSSSVIKRWARDTREPEKAKRLKSSAQRILQRIERLGDVETGDQARGVEGDAARIYFRALSQVLSPGGLDFSVRTRRPPRDPVNAMLGFGYGLLVRECIGAMESVGLDYQMGMFHRPRSGRPSLALDLAEEFRALVDRFVVTLVRRKQVNSKDFTNMPGGGVYLTDEGRKQFLTMWEAQKEFEVWHQLLGRNVGRWALPSVQATLMARHLRGDIPAYPPFTIS